MPSRCCWQSLAIKTLTPRKRSNRSKLCALERSNHRGRTSMIAQFMGRRHFSRALWASGRMVARNNSSSLPSIHSERFSKTSVGSSNHRARIIAATRYPAMIVTFCDISWYLAYPTLIASDRARASESLATRFNGLVSQSPPRALFTLRVMTHRRAFHDLFDYISKLSAVCSSRSVYCLMDVSNILFRTCFRLSAICALYRKGDSQGCDSSRHLAALQCGASRIEAKLLPPDANP
jgi:hypothetical protein